MNPPSDYRAGSFSESSPDKPEIAILLRLPVGVVAHARSGEIVLANAAAAEILGLTIGQLTGRDSFDPRWRAITEEGSPFRGEDHPAMLTLRTLESMSNVVMGVHRPDGELRWISVSTSVLPDPGTDDGPVVVATFIDITARIVAESDLAAARDRAEHADRAKTAFLSVVSHELRTPLTSIVGYAELLNDVHAGALSEDQQEDVNEILAASDRLTRLIDDLLDVGRIEAGRLNLELGVHDVGLIVSRVLHALRPQAEAKGLTLTAGPSNGIQLLVDLERMTQVLTNLVMNAIKFTSIGEVTVTTERDNDMVAITVSDTGVGIPEEKLASIFREFEQADPSPTRRHGGLGLGLPISRGITELHGGTLTVVSTPGKGSAFTVRVPVSD